MGCVYLLTSPSGKGYVGITRHTAAERFLVHVRDSKTSTWSAVHAAMRKYGPESFKLETLLEGDDWSELCAAERRLIAELGTKSPRGYNLTDGGEGVANLPAEVEARRVANSARSRTGKPLSAPHRQSLSLAHLGQISPMKGKKLSDEARQKLSQAAKARWGRMDPAEKRALAAYARSGITREDNLRHLAKAREARK